MTGYLGILSRLFMQLQSDKTLITDSPCPDVWRPLVSPHATDSADPNLNCAKLESDL